MTKIISVGAMLACSLFSADFVVTGVSNEGGTRTRLVVTNRATTAGVVKLRLAGSTEAAVEKVVPALGAIAVEDVFTEWGLADRRGVLLVNADQPAVVVASRYFPLNEGGRAGSPLPVVYRDDLLTAGTFVDFLWAPQAGALDLYTAQSGSEVEVSIWDAAGKKLASRSIKSDEGVHRLELASLASGDWTAMRIEAKVKSGRVAISLDFPDPSNGRWATLAPSTQGMEGRDLVLTQAFHDLEIGGLQFRTDLRLFNPGTTTARITAQLGEREQTLELAPKATAEIEDVLAAWFGIQEPQSGKVRIRSTVAVLASARTIGGTSFEIGTVPQAQPVLTETGAPVLLTGLRDASVRKLLGVLAGETDTVVDITLTDRQGVTIVKTTLEMTAGEWRQFPVDELLAAVTLPEGTSLEDSNLEMRLLTGSADVTLLSLDGLASDLDWVEPQVVLDAPVCSRPVISSLNASPRNLAAAADVVFDWVTRGADTVALQPVTGSVPLSGQQTVRVTQSSSYRLVAANACGETSATLQVSVGKPVLQSVIAFGASAQGSGEPGQVIEIALNNVGDRGRLTGLILREGNRIEMELPVVGFSDTGMPYARIPLLPDSTVAAGYRSGAFTLSAVVDGVESATIPLTIQPMKPVADPVAEMRALLDGLLAIRTPAETDAERDAYAAADRVESALRQVLNEIAATGQGTLRYSSAVAGSVIVRRADLAAVLALNKNYLAQVGSKTSAASIRAAGPAYGTCIDDTMKHMAICRDKEKAEKALWLLTDPEPHVFNNEDLDNAYKQGRDALIKYVTKKLQESALNALLGRMRLILSWTNIVCALQPIRLDDFDMSPRQFEILRNGKGAQTELIALFVPKYKQNEIAQKIEDEEAKKIMDQIPQKYNSLKPLIEPEVKAYAHAIYGELDSEIAALIKQQIPTLTDKDRRRVGRCDIGRFYASLNGPQEDKYDLKKAVVIPVATDRPDWGRDFYFFRGLRRGPETMCIIPLHTHFLLSERQKNRFKENPDITGKCEFPIGGVGPSKATGERHDLVETRVLVHTKEISVTGVPSLSVSVASVNAWCMCDDQERSGIIFPGFPGPTAEVGTDSPYSHAFKWRESAASIGVRKSGEARWEIFLNTNAFRELKDQRVQFHDALAQIRVNFTNPPNRDNTHTIAVTVGQPPGCERPASFSGFVSGITGGSANIVQAPANPFRAFKRYYTGFERGQIQFNLGGELSGFQTITSTCHLTATIEMFDGPPPE